MTVPVSPDSRLKKRNQRVMAVCLLFVAGMVGLSFASVPLYRLFCQVTGFGGTTQTAQSLPGTVIDRAVTVRFNADTNPGLPWHFQPELREINVKLGQGGLIAYRAQNLSDHDVVGNAVYNVTPPEVGPYFHKIQCFCFQEQKLAAKQSVDMPVYFYVDPEMAKDPNLDDVKTITLSYTFFPAKSDDLDRAQKEYYQRAEQQNLPATN